MGEIRSAYKIYTSILRENSFAQINDMNNILGYIRTHTDNKICNTPFINDLAGVSHIKQ